MRVYEVGEIIVQTKGDVQYEIKEVREYTVGFEYLCESSMNHVTMWVLDTSLRHFLNEGKGHIFQEPQEKPINRLDSIE